jgi:hypothetical protein
VIILAPVLFILSLLLPDGRESEGKKRKPLPARRRQGLLKSSFVPYGARLTTTSRTATTAGTCLCFALSGLMME